MWKYQNAGRCIMKINCYFISLTCYSFQLYHYDLFEIMIKSNHFQWRTCNYFLCSGNNAIFESYLYVLGSDPGVYPVTWYNRLLICVQVRSRLSMHI